MTLSLAIGAQRMADRDALVRRLESVETLGSTTFVCTDKTGTLTHNELTAVEVWTPRGSATIEGSGYDPAGRIASDDPDVVDAVSRLARAAVRCSTGKVVPRGSGGSRSATPSTRPSTRCRAGRASTPRATARSTRTTGRFPFDPRRRRMSVVVDHEVFVKGASDGLLPLCAPDRGGRRGAGRDDGAGPPRHRRRDAPGRRHRGSGRSTATRPNAIWSCWGWSACTTRRGCTSTSRSGRAARRA